MEPLISAAVLYGVEDLRLDNSGIPDPSPYDVVIEMDCVGISETDVAYFLNGRFSEHKLEKPMVIGCEGSGVIAKVGRLVKCLTVGDRVGVEAIFGCKTCYFCKLGRNNLCSNILVCGTPSHDGLLANFVSHPSDACYRLPMNVSMEEGALIELLAVAIHTCKRAEISPGSEVLILGCGALGCAVLLVAQAMGATNILMVDYVKYYLDLAAALGAQHTIKLNLEINEKELIKKVKSAMRTEPDKTIDYYGNEDVARVAALSTRAGGCYVAVGLGYANPKMPLHTLCSKEVDIIGVFRHSNEYTSAMSMIACGRINIKPLITHHFELSELNKGMDTAKYKHGMKVMFHCQPKDKNNVKI